MTGEVYQGDGWTITNTDCIDGIQTVPDDSIGLSVYSPPFISLYTYTASERDMGNCASADEFFSTSVFYSANSCASRCPVG